jgi:hypothetical protein
MSDNPFMQTVDLSTGTTSDGSTFSPPYVPSDAAISGSGFLGADGFMSKVGETALDLFGLYGDYEIQKAQIEAATNDSNPEITASQEQAGVVETQFPLKEVAVGGAIVAGVSILVIGVIVAVQK